MSIPIPFLFEQLKNQNEEFRSGCRTINQKYMIAGETDDKFKDNMACEFLWPLRGRKLERIQFQSVWKVFIRE